MLKKGATGTNLRRQLIANVRLHQISSYGCFVFVTGEAPPKADCEQLFNLSGLL